MWAFGLTTILFLVTTRSVADPASSKNRDNSGDSLEDDLKSVLFRRCWKDCQDQYEESTSEKAVLSLINDKFDLAKHEEHCRSYNASKACAYGCLSSPSQEHYVRPFLRRNYLNDFICVRHYEEFRRFLPCYQNHRPLEFYFRKCGYFATESDKELQATIETCAALRCVTRYIPGLIRSECASGDQELAKDAGDFMEKMVYAFLREKVRLNKMKRLCDTYSVRL